MESIDTFSQHNLCYSDLPQNETILYGTLEELGFHSFVARTKLRKEINQKLKETTKNEPNKLPDPNNPAVMFAAHCEKAPDIPWTPAKMLKAHNCVQELPIINIRSNDGTRLTGAG